MLYLEYMPPAPWSPSPYPLRAGRARSFTLAQFSQAMGQVARYDELLGQSYDSLNLALINKNFQWQDKGTGEVFDFFDERAPEDNRTLQFKTAALPEIIDLTDQELHDFQYSNAKYYLRLQLIQILQQTPGPKHFAREYYAYEKRLRRGARAEEFVATLPLIDRHNALDSIHLTFKTPIGSRFDNLLQTDLLNVVIPSGQDRAQVAVLRQTLRTLGEACALKYDYQNYRPTLFARQDPDAPVVLVPPQNQQIEFLMWQTRCLQELVHVYLRTLLRVIFESMSTKRQESLHRNPYTLRPEEFATLIPENLARLLLVEDALQSQILELSERIITRIPVHFELLGVQVKSSRVGLEKHVRLHGATGVIRPPSLLVHNRFSPETPFYTQHVARTIQAYADLQSLWHR